VFHRSLSRETGKLMIVNEHTHGYGMTFVCLIETGDNRQLDASVLHIRLSTHLMLVSKEDNPQCVEVDGYA